MQNKLETSWWILLPALQQSW